MERTTPVIAETPEIGPESSLARGRLGTWGIVFLVFAAMTPLAGLTSTTGLAMTLGSGIGVVGLYIVIAISVLIFQVGYSAMSTEITNAGAFYAYITRGFGRVTGLTASLLSTLMYQMITVILAAFFAFYANITVSDQLGVDIPWQVWAFLAIAAVFFLGRRNIDVSSKLLGIAVVLETLMAVIFVIGVIAHQGLGAFSLDVFNPKVMFGGQIGVCVMMVVYAFGGIESNAIFGEEARNMKKTVRRAGLIAPCFLAVFYVIGAWALVAAFGAANAQQAAIDNVGVMFFVANTNMVGQWSTDLIQWMLCFSFFAALLGVHNFGMRYFFALGRDHVFPHVLAKTHPKTHAPYHAGELQIVCLIVLLGGFMLAGADPMIDIVTGFGGVIVLINTFLWAWVSAAALAYFWKRRDVSVWETKVAPIVATVIMLVLCAVILYWYTDITGAGGIYTQMPWIIPFVIVIGVIYALWLRKNRPATYAILGQLSINEGLEGPVAEEVPQLPPTAVDPLAAPDQQGPVA
jgi:amino acid transporter